MNDHSDPGFENLLEFLKNSRGFDFTGYKRTSLSRRIDKRMQMIDIHDYSSYIDYLTVHPEEFTQLFNTILINVTSFFRDPTTWEYISREVIPSILAGTDQDSTVRVWSAGCASGEETYTIAMLLADAVGVENFGSRVKIYATDLDEEDLNKARIAMYSPKEVEGVPPEYLEKYFERSNGGYVVLKELRRAVIFGRHDVTHDAPISRIDLLLCRNLLMYLNTETQARVLARLHFSIKDGGFLVLGKAEMLLAYSSLFLPVELKARAFRSASKPNFRDRLQLMTANGSEETTRQLANQFQLRESAFNASPIPQLVVELGGSVALANDRARGLFGLTARDIGRPFQDLELSYKPAELRSAINRAQEEQSEITLNSILWNHGVEKAFLDIILSPLHSNGNGINAVLISFIDITVQVNLHEKLEHANVELEAAMGELQSSNEELETTNEELQSTIEELETTNEELQSSNEEMETMNEELQSTNEELQSTNEELEAMGEESRERSEKLFQVNRLLEAIVTSLRGGIIVTDTDMCILSWNRKSDDLWGLRAEEVYQKPLFSLDIGLPVGQLQPMIRSVINGERDEIETTIQALNRRGKEITCNVTLLPLVLTDQTIQGSILVVEDGRG